MMDKTSAKRIVSDTFQAPFDPKRYRDFINEVSNGFDESKARPMRVPDVFAPHVKSCQRLGTFSSPEDEQGDVLIVNLTEPHKLERSRTALRDFVAYELKRNESYKEAGLAAFVAPDSQFWRLSYVRMDYETMRDPITGKIKAEERLTPARRFSYLVGANEDCHTAQTRFLPLLQNTSDHPTLATIEEAFSVEPVTKEFFHEYVRLFKETEAALVAIVTHNKAVRDDFREKGVSTVEFAKKLLGQIVFLYFLQKKGWLGVPRGGDWGDGAHNFLRQHFDGQLHAHKNFFNDVLEPLFYDTLATDRGHEAWCKPCNGRIPFLNGGLFEPLRDYDWRKADVVILNSLFSNTKISDAGDSGTGILDVFDRYNFTVNEAEPLEQEVAIDPEMLGKVFENLIEDNLRKGLGAFYTPREIVHSMCQGSLINYLDTALNHPIGPIRATMPPLDDQTRRDGDSSPRATTRAAEALRHVQHQPVVARKDLDEWIRQSDRFAHFAAAIADGTEDRYPRPADSIRKSAREIDVLLRDITICDPAIGSGAFPVGMMTEIVRARMALTPYFSDVAERDAYHFKRHAIQCCIYGVDIDPGAIEIAKLRLWLSLVVDEEQVRQIRPLPNLDFKVVVGNSLLGFPYKSERMRRVEQLKDDYFDETDSDSKVLLKRQITSELSKMFAGSKASLGYEVTFDFESDFSEVFRLRGGFDIIIANPPYVDSESMVKKQPDIRRAIGSRFVTTKGNWDLYIPFLELSLSKLSRIGTSCLITPNKWLAISYGQRYRAFAKDMIYEIDDYSHFRAFDGVGVFPVVQFASRIAKPTVHIVRVSSDHERLFSTSLSRASFREMSTWGGVLSEHLPLISKLITEHPALKSICSLEEAFTVGEAYKLVELIRDNCRPNGAFRFVNTGTIEPFYSLWGRSQTTYLKTKYMCPIIPRREFKTLFPRRYAQMSSAKIVISGIRHFEAILDLDGECVAGKSTVVIRGLASADDWLCLLGIMNSRLVRVFLKECYSALAMDGGINFTPTNVGDIPVPRSLVSGELLGVVKRIVTLRERTGPDLNLVDERRLASLTEALDEEVFRLYGLGEADRVTIRGLASRSCRASPANVKAIN